MKYPVLTPFRQRQLYIFVFISGLLAFYFLIMDSTLDITKTRKHRNSKTSDYVGTHANYNFYLKPLKQLNPWTVGDSSQKGMEQRSKLILLWSPLFGGWDFLSEGKDSFKNFDCSESRCEITSDRNRLLESNAVLFHVRTMSLTDIPRNRTPDQKWIFFSLESPSYSYFYGFEFMFGMFNWTMTYRSDSDVVIPYGRTVQNSQDTYNESDLYSQWKNKSRMAVWMVSHCSTSSDREGFIMELKNHIDVTTFGECGMAVCAFNKTYECLENFSKKFYFYLAFENAICDDYVTEKFYRTLNFNMIPVVLGGGVYSNIAPPNSFINALDFESVEALSVHLNRVSTNFSLFASYFKWRRVGYTIEDSPYHCNLCEKLHSESFLKRMSYNDISEWWVAKSHCWKWRNI